MAFIIDVFAGTIHHSDKGSQYVSLAYTQRLQEAELLASTGSTGDSYDNAMAESINGLYNDTQTELEKPAGSGAGHTGVGGLVQQSQVTGTTRSHPPG